MNTLRTGMTTHYEYAPVQDNGHPGLWSHVLDPGPPYYSRLVTDAECVFAAPAVPAAASPELVVRVLRPGSCQHPALSDADVRQAHDGNGVVYCAVRRMSAHGQRYICGWWYTRENADGNIVLQDEPVGGGL